MPKVIRPYFGDAAAGKNGRSPSSTIYARTSANVESTKMVTYTKSYKAPVQPNTAQQLSARDKLRQLVLSLKAYKPLFVPGSLYGTLPIPEGTFISNRSKYISIAMKQGISVFHGDAWLDARDSTFEIKLFFDDLFTDFFSWESLFFAVQIRGDVVDSAFYRNQFKVDRNSFSVSYPAYDRDGHCMSAFKHFAVDETDFDAGKPYTARLWASPIAFPAPPVSNQEDATNTWDIGNSVRLDFLFNII